MLNYTLKKVEYINKLDTKQLIVLIRGLFQLRNKTITANHYQKISTFLGYPSLFEIENQFGSWNKFLVAANLLDPNDLTENHTQKYMKKSIRVQKLTIDESIFLYKEKCGLHITIKKYNDFRIKFPKIVSTNTIIRRYGTWKKAVLHFDLYSSGFFSNEQCIHSVTEALELFGPQLKCLTYAKWAQENNKPSLTLVITRLTSWSNAVETAKKLNE